MSTAIGNERIAKVVGYALRKGDFRESSPNLPQRIAIIGEANVANQGDLSTEPQEILSAKQAGDLFGYGSPIHMAMRILRPVTSDGVGGIPTIVYPQAEAGGATRKIVRITPVGTANANGTHFVKVAGRIAVDDGTYAININSGDNVDDITQKIEDAVNSVLASPVSATSTGYEADLTTKWAGLTAQGINVSIDTGENDLGITYVITVEQTGSGTPAIGASLEKFQNEWNTIVVNTYGTVETIMASLEQFNGIASNDTPTGRYVGRIMKPFIALTGSVADNNASLTDARAAEMTIAICPAPLSEAHPLEAAANMALLFARQTQDNPHLDVQGLFYPDMPVPANGIGTMNDYNNRDNYVKKGNSCVELVNARYKVTDFVTTYHPQGENPPQFRYCRNIQIDWNIRYGYFLLENENVIDHAIASDDTIVTATKVVKPKQWNQVIRSYADNLALRGLIVQPEFTKSSITVSISTVNPDRLNTNFRYKRSGFARIASTDAEAGFNFGTIN